MRWELRLDAEQYVLTLNLNRVHRDFLLRVVLGFPGLQVESPGMPGTQDLSILQPAFRERPLPVRAYVIDGGKLPIAVGNANLLSFNGKLRQGVRAGYFRRAA